MPRRIEDRRLRLAVRESEERVIKEMSLVSCALAHLVQGLFVAGHIALVRLELRQRPLAALLTRALQRIPERQLRARELVPCGDQLAAVAWLHGVRGPLARHGDDGVQQLLGHTRAAAPARDHDGARLDMIGRLEDYPNRLDLVHLVTEVRLGTHRLAHRLFQLRRRRLFQLSDPPLEG